MLFYFHRGKMEGTLGKRHMIACFEFAKWHLKDSESMRKKILWFDERKIELSGQNSKHYVWQTADAAHLLVDTITTVKHGGGSNRGWERDWDIETGQNRRKDECSQVQKALWRDAAPYCAGWWQFTFQLTENS